MRHYAKKDFPVENIRRFLEPGPVVLVSSAYRNETNIMTMGWHMVVEFQPSLVGCIISNANHSFEMIHRSRQCVKISENDPLSRRRRVHDRGCQHRPVPQVVPARDAVTAIGQSGWL
jgi:hypothetical protein